MLTAAQCSPAAYYVGDFYGDLLCESCAVNATSDHERSRADQYLDTEGELKAMSAYSLDEFQTDMCEVIEDEGRTNRPDTYHYPEIECCRCDHVLLEGRDE